MTETITSRPRIGLDLVVLDTDDPPRLADFYTALLGWEVERADDDWITLRGDSDARIAFQLAPNHRPPSWPDNDIPQQYHFDFSVDDMDAAVAYATSIGARSSRRRTSTAASPSWSTRPGTRSVCAVRRGRGHPVRSVSLVEHRRCARVSIGGGRSEHVLRSRGSTTTAAVRACRVRDEHR